MHNYHDAHGMFPPGTIDDDAYPHGGYTTGFTLLLPFIEETALYNSYNTRRGQNPSPWNNSPTYGSNDFQTTPQPAQASSVWNNIANSTTIAKQLAQFYCPSNRSEGVVYLGSTSYLAGGTDYGMCLGAIATQCSNPSAISYLQQLGGCFGPNTKTRIKDFLDGTALTVCMGEISGGEVFVGTTDPDSAQPADVTARDGRQGTPLARPWGVDQAWAVAWQQPLGGTPPAGTPLGSVFFSGYQHVNSNAKIDGSLTGGDPQTGQIADFPAKMNPRLVRQARISTDVGDPGGAAQGSTLGVSLPDYRCVRGDDRLPEVRCNHEGGSQFLFGDGSVRFVSENIDVKIYGYIMTIKGREIVDEDDL
jgi:prepilin-type processing-associated H-X9-DG protein